MSRIYVLLISKDSQSCKETVASMVTMANHPRNLTIQMAILNEKEEELVNIAAPAGGKVEYFLDVPLEKVQRKMFKEIKNEKYALQIIGETVFELGWDSLLKEMVNFPKDKNTVFSYLPKEEETYALGLKSFNDDGDMQFGHGIKASSFFEPVEGLFAYSQILFGYGWWMKKAREDRWNFENPLTLSTSIFASDYKVYTGNRFICMPQIMLEDLIAKNTNLFEAFQGKMDQDILDNFYKKAELSPKDGEISIKSFLGLGVLYKPYMIQVSLAKAIIQRKGVKLQGESTIKPMFVTAWEGKKELLEQQLQLEHFYYLSNLSYFPLTAYGPSQYIKVMQRILPNSFPLEENGRKSDGSLFVKKEIGTFLIKAMEQFPLYTHYGWIDIDYLPCCLYEKQAFNWEVLEDGKIYVGFKNGEMDLSLIIVPNEKVVWFAEQLEEGYILKMETEEIILNLIADYGKRFMLYDYGEDHQLLEAFFYE